MSTAPAWGEVTPALPPLPDPMPGADLYVVGLGGAGLAAVAEGLRQGKRVVGIDRVGVAGGASGRNGGFLLAGRADFFHRTVAAIGSEAARAIYQLTVAEIRRMAEETPECVRPVGSLRVAGSAEEEGDLVDHYTALRLAGISVERRATPWGPGVFLADDAAFDPVARSAALAAGVVAAGARLFRGEVAGVADLPTPAVVAVDAGLEHIVPSLAGRVRTARLQMLATAPTDEVAIPQPVYRRWGYDYWQQRPDGSVVAGGLRDQFEADEWLDGAAAPSPSAAVQSGLDTLVRTVIGVTTAPVTHRWAGTSGFTADHRPICEVVGDGIVAVGGYSGTGNVIGPLCGRAAVQLLFGGSSAIADVLRA